MTEIPENIKVRPMIFCSLHKFLQDYPPNFDQRYPGQCAIQFPLADKQLKVFFFFSSFPKG